MCYSLGDTKGTLKVQHMFTEETFKKALPANMRKNVSLDVMHNINASISDPDIRDHVLENILSYTSVLKDGKFKLQSYLDGVKYVSFKTMGDSNIQAWVKTFPDRYARLVANNASEKDISAHVAMFNSTKIVALLYEQTLRPIHIMNAHHAQAAINKLVTLMDTALNERVQMESADKLLIHLKPPETKKIELDVGIKESSALASLKQLTAEYAAQQKRAIEAGIATAKEMAHQSLVIEGEFTEDDE